MEIRELSIGAEPPRPLALSGAALFLDLDGTLAPIAARPQDVHPDPHRTGLVERLEAAMKGRLAVISGRALEDVDRILEGRVPSVAAVHGLVRRDADGQVHRSAAHPDVARASEAFRRLAETDPGLLVEDKGQSVALHYRLAPHRAAEAHGLAEEIARQTGLMVQAGHMVVELRTPGPTKSDSVRAFMAAPPFLGAAPIFVGDDITDEDGFAAVWTLGGFGVLVGPQRRTHARWRLDDVSEALAWLEAAL
jgi:trehalose 6-phosphate phosphatase